MSINELIVQLKEIEKKRQKILKSFSNDSALVVGSITHTKGRCGKANCACYEKPTHDITLLMTRKNGKMKTQLIRKNDVKKIVALWKEYKYLKKMIKILIECNQKEIEVLDQIICCRTMNYKPS